MASMFTENVRVPLVSMCHQESVGSFGIHVSPENAWVVMASMCYLKCVGPWVPMTSVGRELLVVAGEVVVGAGLRLSS